MTVLALIPARSGSKGVKNKNIRKLGGHSLLEWSIAACKSSKLIDTIIVSTDSKLYADEALKAGASVPFLRPPAISKDFSTDLEFVLHTLDWLNTHDTVPSYIVHIRPTTPLRLPSVIDNAISAFQDSTASALRSVHKMPESAYKCFEISDRGYLYSFNSNPEDLDRANIPRQQLPDTYVANGYVDVLDVDRILRTNQLHGPDVMPFLTEISHEVDVEEDFRYLEHQLNSQQGRFSCLFE